MSFVWPSVQPPRRGALSSSENICKDIYWGIKGNKTPRLLLLHVLCFILTSGLKVHLQLLLLFLTKLTDVWELHGLQCVNADSESVQ